MKSLDELLAERAELEYKEELNKTLDFSQWTRENRDKKLEEIRDVSKKVCDVTENFVKEILDTKIEGKSILWNKVLQQIITGEIEMLMGFRDELDLLEEEDLIGHPITSEWIGKQLRKRYKEIVALSNSIEKAMATPGEVQTL